MTAAVDGAAAAALAGVARERWRRATGQALRPVRVDADPWPEGLAPDLEDVRVGIACTAPERENEAAVRQVEKLYLEMIARARRTIYFENQYFTSGSVARALEARLARPQGPEIVLVTRLLSHGWLEEVTMQALRARLIRYLQAADRHGRFHVYYPHLPGLPEGQCVDLHAKLAIVDDEWLRIGSSNLSNRSMGLDTECDVVVDAEGRSATRAGIRACRDRLLGEHLGLSPEEVARRIREAGTISGAVAALASDGRTLKPLEQLTELPVPVVDAIAVSVDPEKPVSLDGLLEQLAPVVDPPSGRRRFVLSLATAGLLLALTLLWRFTPLADLADADRVVLQASELGQRWWTVPAVVLGYTLASFLLFPRALITLTAVVALGPWTAFACAMGGSVIAAAVGYVVGRTLRRDTVRRLTGERLNRLSQGLRRQGVLALTAMRLVPLGPFALQNILAGAVRVRLSHFLVATFLGMLPGTLATTLVGKELQAMLLGSRKVDVPMLLLLAVAMAGGALLVRRRLSRVADVRLADPRAPRGAPSPAQSA